MAVLDMRFDETGQLRPIAGSNVRIVRNPMGQQPVLGLGDGVTHDTSAVDLAGMRARLGQGTPTSQTSRIKRSPFGQAIAEAKSDPFAGLSNDVKQRLQLALAVGDRELASQILRQAIARPTGGGTGTLIVRDPTTGEALSSYSVEAPASPGFESPVVQAKRAYLASLPIPDELRDAAAVLAEDPSIDLQQFAIRTQAMLRQGQEDNTARQLAQARLQQSQFDRQIRDLDQLIEPMRRQFLDLGVNPDDREAVQQFIDEEAEAAAASAGFFGDKGAARQKRRRELEAAFRRYRELTERRQHLREAQFETVNAASALPGGVEAMSAEQQLIEAMRAIRE